MRYDKEKVPDLWKDSKFNLFDFFISKEMIIYEYETFKDKQGKLWSKCVENKIKYGKLKTNTIQSIICILQRELDERRVIGKENKTL